MMIRYISIFIFSVFAIGVVAQPTIKQVQAKALEEYYNGNYYGAAQYFQKVIDRGENQNEENWFFLAQAMQKHYAYNEAEQAYHYLIDTLKTEKYHNASFDLAQIKTTLGKYEEASRYYDLYLAEYEGDDSRITKMAKLGKESSDWASAQLATARSISDDSVFVENMGTDVNTPYSEHAAIQQEDGLYYSSLRFPKKTRTDKYQEVVSKVLKYDTISNVLDGDKFLNNGNQLSSSTAFSNDGSVMIYSICDYGDDALIDCELYYRKKTDDAWGTEYRLPDTINVKGKTTTHPSFGPDEMGKTTVYFVSDRMGGKGALDVWQTAFDSDMNWDIPSNLNDINSAGDDVTPFYNSATSTLYFSTNGKVGMGGMDVFKTIKEGKSYSAVENLGKDFNSPQEDIYFTINEDESEGYMSSNRFGSMFLEDKFETCCFDIYKVNINPCTVDLLALLYDDETKLELEGVTLKLRDLNDPKAEVITITNDESNDFEYHVECDKEYEIIAEKEGYYPDTLTFKSGDGSVGIEKKIYLKPIPPEPVELQVNLFERATKDPLNLGEVTLIDLETGESIVIKELNGHVHKFDVFPGKEYKIIARKAGYEDEEVTFIVDEDAKGIITKDIYMGRIAEVNEIAKLIPLKLYFDNDEPERRTLSQTTNQTFSETYHKYYAKQDEFKETYEKRFKNADRPAASARIESFFNTEVKDGQKTLQIFMEALERTLQKGLSINLYLRGYASPIASNEYNYAIGQRRVQSIRNEFARYNNGILSKYLDSGKLKIQQRSFGEETAPDGISDSENNPRLSIFSPEASRERRIELEEIVEAENN